MKKFFAPVLIATAAMLAGCGDSSSTSGTPSGSAPAPAPAKSDTVAEVQKAVTDAANKAVSEVKKEAQAAISSLSQQLIDSTKGGSTDALLKNISTDLESRLQKLTTSLGQSIPSLPAPTASAVPASSAPAPAAGGSSGIAQSLEAGVKSLLGGKDADAVGALSQLTKANLTPEQGALAKDVYNAAAAFVTQRNFSSLEGSSSDVGQLVNAVWKGNYTAALQPLQSIYSKASLTPEQKNLLGATFDQYMPAGWKDAAGTVQEGLKTLKKFGL